jgi:flagellar basal body-associated protein FliL
MLENLKKIVSNIQAASETKKKRWLFILSVLIMVLVVSFWMAYLNKTIVNLGTTEQAESNNQPQQISKESPWQVFITGLKTVTTQIKDLINTTRKITIETNPSNTTSTLEEIIPQQ